MDDFTGDELYVIVRLLQGRMYYKHKKGYTDSIRYSDEGGEIYLIEPDFKSSTFNRLASQNYMLLVPPPDGMRHNYVGRWMINWNKLKDHPQLNELKLQAVLNTVSNTKSKIRAK